MPRSGSAGSDRFRNYLELLGPVPRFHTFRWEPEPSTVPERENPIMVTREWVRGLSVRFTATRLDGLQW